MKERGNKIRGTFGGTKGVKKTLLPILSLFSASPFLSLSVLSSPLRPFLSCVVLLIFGQRFFAFMRLRLKWK